MRVRYLAVLPLLAATSLGGCEGMLLDPSGDPFSEWRPTDPDVPIPETPLEPGRVTMRRLNRTELEHTVQDLLGITGSVSADFPADDRGYGYDNNGDVLSTSALHVELLSREAERWVDASLGTESDPGPGRERILLCDVETDGETCVRSIIAAFARRVWRRPATESEIVRLVGLGSIAMMHGDGLAEGVRLALVATLISPHFLYRVELDADPTAITPQEISDYELASRLSYFLWASTPDDMLLDLAEAGVLHDETILRDQALRMLEDDRARSLVDDFAGQWLFSRLVGDHVTDYETFPEWTPELASSARGEMERFFAAFMFEDRTMTGLLDADFSYVDDRLAAHYGIEIPADAIRDEGGFARVTLPPERHAGLLSKAGLLAVTSQPNRTSPVKRGVWVLEQLLCAAPPAPPPDVEGFDSTEVREGETLRERFERHRSDPVCASCHTVMDPIGFGLEGFDAIGRTRTMDGGGTIDDSGVMPGGVEFEGPAELAALLAEDARFPRCVSRQMMTYALGRGVEHESDTVWVAAVTERMLEQGGTMRALALEIVTSPPFRMRSPEVSE